MSEPTDPTTLDGSKRPKKAGAKPTTGNPSPQVKKTSSSGGETVSKTVYHKKGHFPDADTSQAQPQASLGQQQQKSAPKASAKSQTLPSNLNTDSKPTTSTSNAPLNQPNSAKKKPAAASSTEVVSAQTPSITPSTAAPSKLGSGKPAQSKTTPLSAASSAQPKPEQQDKPNKATQLPSKLNPSSNLDTTQPKPTPSSAPNSDKQPPIANAAKPAAGAAKTSTVSAKQLSADAAKPSAVAASGVQKPVVKTSTVNQQDQSNKTKAQPAKPNAPSNSGITQSKPTPSGVAKQPLPAASSSNAGSGVIPGKLQIAAIMPANVVPKAANIASAKPTQVNAKQNDREDSPGPGLFNETLARVVGQADFTHRQKLDTKEQSVVVTPTPKQAAKPSRSLFQARKEAEIKKFEEELAKLDYKIATSLQRATNVHKGAEKGIKVKVMDVDHRTALDMRIKLIIQIATSYDPKTSSRTYPARLAEIDLLKRIHPGSLKDQYPNVNDISKLNIQHKILLSIRNDLMVEDRSFFAPKSRMEKFIDRLLVDIESAKDLCKLKGEKIDENVATSFIASTKESLIESTIGDIEKATNIRETILTNSESSVEELQKLPEKAKRGKPSGSNPSL